MIRRSAAPEPRERSDRANRTRPVRADRIDLSAAPSAMEERAAAWGQAR